MMKKCCFKKSPMTLYYSPSSPNSRIPLLVARNVQLDINVNIKNDFLKTLIKKSYF